jgi:phage shock protein C
VADHVPEPPEPDGRRVLRRSRSDRVIGGVCGGLGRYLGVDAVLLRIAFVVLAVAGGGGILLYVVAWVLIPEERPGEPLGSDRPSRVEATRLIVGGTLIAVGTILLLDLSLGRIGRYFWPLALIAIGVAVVVQAAIPRR